MKLSDIKFIVVHCSDSPHGRGDNAETIHRWHLEKGWDGVGYNRVILEDGTIEHGRPLYWVGSHAKGYNNRSVGICLIGAGFYTPQQWDALSVAIHDILEQCPQAVVVGHNDINTKKECPMFDVKAWWMSLGND